MSVTRMLAGVMLLAGLCQAQAQPPSAQAQPPSAQAQAPSLATAQSAYAAGEYRQALQEISRFLGSSQARAGSRERYDALMLRGETMLRLNEPQLASSAFASAAQVSNPNMKIADTANARALSLLVRSTREMRYTPAGAEPIDISEPESRKKALVAMFNERLEAIKPRIAAALKSTSLEPIYQLVPDIGDLFSIEIAATGEPKETEPLLKSLGEHARKLITDELTRLGGQIQQLETLANEPTSTGALGRGFSRRGLTSIEQNQLSDAIAYLDKIRRVCQDGRRANRRFGGTGETWDPIAAEATDLRDRAQTALNNR